VLIEANQRELIRAKRSPAMQAEKEWDVGRQKIIQGDCLATLRGMPAGSVDVIVTSPPYNIGIAYNTYEDRQPRASYLRWVEEIGREIGRVMSQDGSFFLNIGSTSSDPWIAQDVAGVFRNVFCLQNSIVWVKSISIGYDTVGHFKPITSKRYLNPLLSG
jgi:site-specific DNA-methyltransferase (adenine-specific)